MVLSVAAALGLLLLATGACAAGPKGSTAGPERTVRALLSAIDEGDMGRAMSLLAPGFAMRTWDGEALIHREGYQAMIGWDVVADGERRIERFEVRGDTVTLRIEERNRFTELLRLDPFRVETRYRVRDGAIADQWLRELMPEGSPSYTERFLDAIGPALAWAKESAPTLLGSATDGGTVTYDEPSARALLELLRRYHQREEARE